MKAYTDILAGAVIGLGIFSAIVAIALVSVLLLYVILR